MIIKKRIFNIAIEAFQNAVKHGIGKPAMQIKREGNRCVIESSNLIRNDQRQTITERISGINALGEAQLKSKYLEVLQGPANAQSCGLGLLFMRRKSGLPVEFNFKEIDNLHSYFYLRITLIF